MPKKRPEERRSHIIGVKVDQETKDILNYLAKYEDVKLSTYIYNVLTRHIETVNPYIKNEINVSKKENSNDQ